MPKWHLNSAVSCLSRVPPLVDQLVIIPIAVRDLRKVLIALLAASLGAVLTSGARSSIGFEPYISRKKKLNTFKQLDLIEPLQRALDEANYQKPTDIQAKAIPEALDGLDVLGCAQTGTGKTAAFVLPILDYLGSEPGRAVSGKPFVLILAPTRELAIQIRQSIESYGKHLSVRSTVVFGGVNQSRQVKSLQRGAHILVATPGRLLDLMQQGHISLDRLETFVLDEADRMLDMGFLPDLKRIIRCLPEERQSLFFSATLCPKTTSLAKSLLFKPVTINVTPKSRSVDRIKQQMLFVQTGEKMSRLKSILNEDAVSLAVVFTRTKRAANRVEKSLKQDGINAAAIHGNKSQANRERTLEGFRKGRIKVLVATDVAARGIDVNDISHVINFDLPGDTESYVHRIGRTGRAGAEGQAISFYTADQQKEVRDIEQFAGVNFNLKPQPQPKQRSQSGGRAGNKPGGKASGKPRRSRNSRRKKGSTSGRSAEFSAQTSRHRNKKRSTAKSKTVQTA